MIRFVLFLLWLSCSKILAQNPERQFDKQLYDSTRYSRYQKRKNIPNEIKPQVLIALAYYPELHHTNIRIRNRKRKTPLASRPQMWSIFKKRNNRTYVITISSTTTSKLKPILFHRLPYNAQIGVIGHELAHISDYKQKSTLQLLELALSLLSSKNVDKFEFETDLNCINHGLGYQLYDWSQYVRHVLNIPEWRGTLQTNYRIKSSVQGQRYMNPKTIKECISKNSMYDNHKSKS